MSNGFDVSVESTVFTKSWKTAVFISSCFEGNENCQRLDLFTYLSNSIYYGSKGKLVLKIYEKNEDMWVPSILLEFQSLRDEIAYFKWSYLKQL